MRPSRHKPLKRQQPPIGGRTLRNKIILPAASLASAAAAFGIGALVFTGPSKPADASPLPQPTKTVTAPPVVVEKATEGAQDDVQRVGTRTVPAASPVAPSSTTAAPRTATKNDPASAPRTTEPKPAPAKPKAGSKGPFTDADSDGKVLDDMKPSLPLAELPIDVPDKLLPFPGPGYTGPPTTEAYSDVVSAPNVITDPDKPWFHLPTTPPEEPVASVPTAEPEPVVTVEPTPVATEPVRTGGPVFGRNPFRTLG
jgi:hypothetical protein